MNRFVFRLAACAALVLGTSARAGVILDYSPATAGTDFYGVYNNDAGQHFYEPVSFAQGGTVTGIALYSPISASYVGEAVRIDVYDNVFVAGADRPNNNIYNVATTLSAVDNEGVGSTSLVRVFASLPTPLTMNPGELLWISLAGASNNNLGAALMSDTVGPNKSFQASPAGYNGIVPNDVSMRLYGTVVPEPASLALLGAAAGGLLVRRG